MIKKEGDEMSKCMLYAAVSVCFSASCIIGIPCGPNVLNVIPESPFTVPGFDPFPVSVAFSPDGKLLATANQSKDTVAIFTVASDGRLTSVGGSPFSVPGVNPTPVSVAFSPDGKFLATANFITS